jgi:hypothetical protein
MSVADEAFVAHQEVGQEAVVGDLGPSIRRWDGDPL